MATQEYDSHTATSFDAAPALDGAKTLEAPVASRPRVEVAGLAKRALLSLWRGRGLIGGLLAIGLAYLGQQALLSRNDYQTSTRNYVLAIIILIISLTHPSWELVRRVRDRRLAKGKAADAPVAAEATSIDAVREAALITSDAPAELRDISIIDAVSVQGQVTSPAAIGAVAATVPTRRARSHTATAKLPIAVGQVASAVAAPGVSEAAQAQAGSRVWAALHAPANLWRWWVGLRTRLGWRATVPGLAIAGGLAVWAGLVLLGDIRSSLGGWLWAGSLAMLLVTFLGAREWPRGDGLLPTPVSDFFAKGLPSLSGRWEAALVLAMMALATFLRLNSLEYHPGIFGDEGEQGLEVRAIIEGRIAQGAPVTGQTAPLFGYGWWQVPNLSFYVWSFTLRIFGDSMFGLRMFSAISGIIAVFYIYRIGRLLWGPRAGLIAGTMLAVSPLALQFSKFANVSSATSALWAVGFFYFFMALRYRKWSDWILSGFFWSLNLYFYPSGKLIIPLVGAAGLYCLIRWRVEFFKRYLLGFALLGVAFALTFMPYYIFSDKYDVQRWYGFAGRAGETSIFSPQNQAATFARYNIPYNPVWAGKSTLENIRQDPGPWAQLIYQQSRETMDALHRRGDQVFYYRLAEMNRPVFSPLWAVLALLGLAYAAWKVWDARFALNLVWFGFGLAASILTVDTPNLQRFAGAWPVAMIFPAVLIDRVFAAGWPLSRRLARQWATLPVAALLVYLGIISYNEYFVEYAATCPYCRDTAQARYAQGLGQEYKAYQMGVGNGYDVYFGYGSTRFAAKGVEGREMLDAADTLPLVDTNGKGAAFIVYPHNGDYLPVLRLMYPGGLEEPVTGSDGSLQFTSYKVTKEQVARSQTVHATYNSSYVGNAIVEPIERDEPQIGNLDVPSSKKGSNSLPPTPVIFRSDAVWQGGLVVPTYGAYTLVVEGEGVVDNVSFSLDGRMLLTLPVLDGNTPPEARQVEMVLAKGVHEVRLSGTLRDQNSKVGLMWASGGPPIPIESKFLYNGPTGGLLGEIGPYVSPDALKLPDPLGAQPRTQRRSDSFIGFREASVIFGPSYTAWWRGTLNVPTEGDYSFNIASVGPAVLLIDDQTVFGDGPNGPGPGTVHLAAGAHPVDIRYVGAGVPTRAEWLWSVAGAQPQIVPPIALTPLARSWSRSEMPDAPPGQLPPPENVAAPEVKQPVLTVSEGLSKPKGIGVDGDGNMYVGDRGNSRVVVFSPDGKKLREWGKAAPSVQAGQQPPPHQPGEFAEISDLAVTQDGTVYVFDGAPRVQAFRLNGEYIGSFGPEQLGLYGPNGIAAETPSKESEGRKLGLYIAVTGQNRVLRLPSVEDVLAGRAKLPDNTESVTGVEGGRIEQPVDVVADPSGTGALYEADLNFNNHRMARLKPRGDTPSPAREWAIDDQWRLPLGGADGGSRLAISPDGKRVYMTDPDRKRVAVLDPESGEISYFGREGGGAGEFGRPTGIAVGGDGKIYVVDAGNNNVQVFSP